MPLIKRTLASTFISALILFSTHALAEEPSPTVQTSALAGHIVHQMVDAAVADCSSKGYKVAASVTDRHGNLVAFLRAPLAGAHTILVSQRKAYTSATLQAPTSSLANRTDLSFADNILLITGGLPISIGGTFYGGIAVSGAEPEIDEECAQAGIDAVADTIEFGE